MYTYHNPLLLQNKFCCFCQAQVVSPARYSFVGLSCDATAFKKTAKSKSFVQKELYKNNVTNFGGKSFFSTFAKPLKSEKTRLRLYFSTSVMICEFSSFTYFAKQTSVTTIGHWRPSKAFPSTRLPCSLIALRSTSSKQTPSKVKTDLFAKPCPVLATTCFCYAIALQSNCFATQAKQAQVAQQSKQNVQQLPITASSTTYYLQSKSIAKAKSKVKPKELHSNTETFNFLCALQNVPEIKLFVNLLMKHGKKAKALLILEIAALLFIKSISKTDLFVKMPLQRQQTQVQNKKVLKKGVSLLCSASTALLALQSKQSQAKQNSASKGNSNPTRVDLDFVLKCFYVEGKTFANSHVIPKKSVQSKMIFSKKKPAQAFFSSFRIIEATANKTRFHLCKGSNNREKNKKFWYINNTPDRWHQLSDAQKNTLLFALQTAISNVKPPLEVRSKRVGGSNRQVPAAVSENRQRGYAVRWIIESANSEKALACKAKQRTKNSNCVPLFCISLAAALKNAFYKKGAAFQKRNLWVETAQANRAFLRYRWW